MGHMYLWHERRTVIYSRSWHHHMICRRVSTDDVPQALLIQHVCCHWYIHGVLGVMIWYSSGVYAERKNTMAIFVDS